jgi:hypothetical protein
MHSGPRDLEHVIRLPSLVSQLHVMCVSLLVPQYLELLPWYMDMGRWTWAEMDRDSEQCRSERALRSVLARRFFLDLTRYELVPVPQNPLLSASQICVERLD